MAWLKQGDAASNHPIVLSALEMDDADDRILNECFGFICRCATQSAAYEQDYIITVGTAKHMAGSIARYNALIAAAKFCGYITEVEVDLDGGGKRRAFKLVEDNDLFHMILKAERDWNNQRKRDTRNTSLTWQVRARDGDACRYCGKSVHWGDTKSGRGATYDHVNPGETGTVETLVVCCKECNSRRQDDPDSTWKTLPVPAEPLYGPATVAFVRKHGKPIDPTYNRVTGTPLSAATAPPAATAQERRDTQPATATPADDTETTPAATAPPAATEPTGPNTDPGQRSPGPRFVGTGRDGTGLAGKGHDGTGHAGAGLEGKQTQPPPQRKQPRKPKKKRTRPRSRKNNQ